MNSEENNLSGGMKAQTPAVGGLSKLTVRVYGFPQYIMIISLVIMDAKGIDVGKLFVIKLALST
jgi:hypothetical protein